MIDPRYLYDLMQDRGIRFFAGVPDSLLKPFCACVQDIAPVRCHVITANEGNAIALAAGHHLATGDTPMVYMQNSGLGNAVNPIASLADPEVYGIPMLLVVGWRGEPGCKDEPQHVKQGRITPGQLDLLEIPYRILDAASDPAVLLDELLGGLALRQGPVALLVREGTFGNYSLPPRLAEALPTREAAIGRLLDLMDPASLVVSTTGKTSRELNEWRVTRKETPRDFLTVGAMGHTSSIALGVALGAPGRSVVCLDGDGSLLMHLGAVPIIGDLQPTNLIHVILNNCAHESVGGQPTVAGRVDLEAVARACGYQDVRKARTLEELDHCWKALAASPGPVLLEILLQASSRNDLGRPTATPEENKRTFVCTIRSGVQ